MNGRLALPVDGHVHFHRLEQVGPTLDAAAENFARFCGARTGWLGAILLVEAAGERVFERLLDSRSAGPWQFARVPAEPQTLIAQTGSAKIAVVCGRQVRCARGLEVLALGTVARFKEGQPLDETIEHVQAAGSLAAVPWGFGKWTGARGRQVHELFLHRPPASIFVGDNGGRIEWLGLPALVRTASEAGFRILPGTDPFPFGGDHRRVGAFGFVAAVEPSLECPWTDLRTWLEAQVASPPAYGRALNPARFIVNQVWIQVHNRIHRKAAA